MHCDTRLLIVCFWFTCCSPHYTDEQSYLSLVEFQRGGPSTNLILASPHGGFLGANLTSGNVSLSTALLALPIGGCYNNTLDRCVYTLRDCLRSTSNESETLSFQADARCMLDRSSTSAMNLLTKAIADAFALPYRPYTISNKLTRQYVDPVEDLLMGTFLLEGATRTYMDYHRLIAMAKEAIRPASHGLFIEFVFHKNSQTVQLGYGVDNSRTSPLSKAPQSTIIELLARSGSKVIRGNHSFGHFLHHNGFENVLPLDTQSPSQAQGQRTIKYRLSTHSTRTHADQRLNAILFSYPIERLRTHTLKREATRIARAIEQFLQTNRMQTFSSSLSVSFVSANSILILFLCLSQSLFSHVH